ncbi:MAG TPA: isoprenylcysteine carboxylmethyltransferase family protein [Bacteroidia bacterium]|nr:isoprenylcysteine carboxylmethyltransferase family protein [Bacteroidia bacterium]
MNLKVASLIAFGVALIGVFFLIDKNYIFSKNPISIIIQICAVALMIWARLTFGVRSFNASANATTGKLITNGPYHFLRHPIYAALIYFFIASIISFPFYETIAAVGLIIAGLFVRMILEEKSLLVAYGDYAEYSKKTKRIIPFVF